MYSQTTKSLKVTVVPYYQDDLSVPHQKHYVWEYNIFVENFGEEPVKLVSRKWRIINSEGKIEEVQGAGVVGQQPLIKPGEAFEYSSQAHLSTASGIMFGSYSMVTEENGEAFEIDVPAFSLDSPYERRQPN
jgi:ApaG protein